MDRARVGDCCSGAVAGDEITLYSGRHMIASGTIRTSRHVRFSVARGGIADVKATDSCRPIYEYTS